MYDPMMRPRGPEEIFGEHPGGLALLIVAWIICIVCVAVIISV
jgi:hypothetical protein